MKSLEVFMRGHHAGELIQERRDAWTLRYDSDYTDTPVSLSLLVGATHKPTTVRHFAQNLLPERQDTLLIWQRRYKIVDINDPFEVLSHVGDDLTGALQITPGGAQPTAIGEQDAVASVASDASRCQRPVHGAA